MIVNGLQLVGQQTLVIWLLSFATVGCFKLETQAVDYNLWEPCMDGFMYILRLDGNV